METEETRDQSSQGPGETGARCMSLDTRLGVNSNYTVQDLPAITASPTPHWLS